MGDNENTANRGNWPKRVRSYKEIDTCFFFFDLCLCARSLLKVRLLLEVDWMMRDLVLFNLINECLRCLRVDQCFATLMTCSSLFRSFLVSFYALVSVYYDIE